MASAKVVLFLTNRNKAGESPLYIRITKDRKIKYASLGVNIFPKDWDDVNSKVKKSHSNYLRINSYIQHKVAEAEDIVLEMITDSKWVPTKAIKHKLFGTSGTEFIPYAEAFIKKYEDKGKIGTFNRFNAVKEKMKKFIDGKKFTFDDLTTEFLKQYEVYMRGTFKNGNNTIHANMKAIMRISNEAIRDNILAIEKNPFLNYKIAWENTEKIFLTETELAAMENLVLDLGSMKYHHRNIYIFACYAGGMRISDIITLRWENFNNTHILLKTQKTGSVISIKVPDKALKILDLYKNPDSKQKDFIFPFIKNGEKANNPKSLHDLISTITAYTNIDLKDLAKLAKIEKHIHFHTSRHTWATRALKKGMRIEYVSKLMGHSSIRTTQVYAKIVNEDLDNAMDVFNDKPIVQKKVKMVKQKKV